MGRYCVVIDIGKTNAKIHVMDDRLQNRFRRSRANKVIDQGIYPHYDTHALWRWIRGTLAEIASDYPVDAINITTHGATAALVHPDAGESGLVLPIMDYEYAGVASTSDYASIRPLFWETLSPVLPAGLNLGRQLFWQQRYCKRAFDGARYILPYPQYWAWRLTGKAVAEVTSWGCHTDLWAPRAGAYSSLVDVLGLVDKLPPLVKADCVVGPVSEAVAEQTGLSPECRVYAGLHDSNASYLRYLARETDQPFTVMSTGTWVVSFSSATDLDCLDERRDMLANVDINGNPVACARFMGGREFDAICKRTGTKPVNTFRREDIRRIIETGAIALPDFSDGSGPFGGRTAEIHGRVDNGAALATLYCALMQDVELDLLGASGDLIIEGAWLRNPLLCSLLAALRPQQTVYLSSDETGTVSGAAQLALGIKVRPNMVPVEVMDLPGLDDYRRTWRQQLSEKTGDAVEVVEQHYR